MFVYWISLDLSRHILCKSRNFTSSIFLSASGKYIMDPSGRIHPVFKTHALWALDHLSKDLERRFGQPVKTLRKNLPLIYQKIIDYILELGYVRLETDQSVLSVDFINMSKYQFELLKDFALDNRFKEVLLENSIGLYESYDIVDFVDLKSLRGIYSSRRYSSMFLSRCKRFTESININI